MNEDIKEQEVKEQDEDKKYPNFVCNGITAWKNKTKTGEEYLSLQFFGKGGFKINLWAYKPIKKE